MSQYLLLFIITVGILAVCVCVTQSSEGFKGQKQAHCPKSCSPFLYPDMYSPLSSCSDPFNWGSPQPVGRCWPVRPAGWSRAEGFGGFDSSPWISHGGGAQYNDAKHTKNTGSKYNYSYS